MKRTRKEVQGKASRPLTLQFDPQPLTAFSGLILFQHLFASCASKRSCEGAFAICPTPPPTPTTSSSSCSSCTCCSAFVTCAMSTTTPTTTWSNAPWPATPPRRRLHQPTIEHHRCDQRRAPACAQPPPRARAPRPPSPRANHARLRRLGARHPTPCRRHRRRIQQEEERPAQLLPVVRHHRPDPSGPRPTPPPPATCMTPTARAHSSNTASDSVRDALPGTRVESRMDSAFYNETLIDHLHRTGVTFTASVPFERWTDLKSMVEHCEQWSRGQWRG